MRFLAFGARLVQHGDILGWWQVPSCSLSCFPKPSMGGSTHSELGLCLNHAVDTSTRISSLKLWAFFPLSLILKRLEMVKQHLAPWDSRFPVAGKSESQPQLGSGVQGEGAPFTEDVFTSAFLFLPPLKSHIPTYIVNTAVALNSSATPGPKL